MRAKAKQAGIYGPQLPAAWGGLGLSWRDRSVILEEAGRSFLAPLAMNCAPPDQPNMINLLTDGSPAQQERYLAPLARGETRSCFAMTEPEPGAGSDPSMLQTVAVRRRGGWSISGRKWFISGAVGASFALVLARTCEGATIFIVDADNPGYRVVRNIASIDGFQIGGHGEIELEDCLVGDDAVLGEVGRGFVYAQLRLERRACRTACASSDVRRARWRWRRTTRTGEAPSASPSRNCSRCRRWWRIRTSTCTQRD